MSDRRMHLPSLRLVSHRSGRTAGRWPLAALGAVGGRFARRLFRVRVEGREHLPAKGPAIIAANHLSFFDHVALVLSARRRLTFVGKAEYLESWKTRLLLPALGMIPIDRDNPRRGLRALEQAANVLRANQLFAIYPEGTRSRDGALHAGHTGVGHLSMTTGVPVIPTGIIGTDHIQPPGAHVPRPFTRAVVRFGEPIDPAGYGGTRRERRRRITGDVMHAIAQLTGQMSDGDTDTQAPRRQGLRNRVIAGTSTILPAAQAGETLHIDERMVVSPAAGVFRPLRTEGIHVSVGQRIGDVCTRTTVVPVRTPFTGELVAIEASDGQRVDRHQRIAWLRRHE